MPSPHVCFVSLFLFVVPQLQTRSSYNHTAYSAPPPRYGAIHPLTGGISVNNFAVVLVLFAQAALGGGQGMGLPNKRLGLWWKIRYVRGDLKIYVETWLVVVQKSGEEMTINQIHLLTSCTP